MTADAHEQELIYAPAVIILSSDLYPRKLEIVREYIQNASDAIDSFDSISDIIGDTSDLQIKISIQGKSLLIWDNGIGMDREEIHKLKRIAYSEKKEGEAAGYKGIGRLAGIAAASKLIISSTSYGNPKLYKFEFCAKDFQEDIVSKRRTGIQEPASVVINRHLSISEYDVDPQEHYTMVELREIDDAYPELLDPMRLREFIGDIAPVGFAPNFSYGSRISEKLSDNVPDYSPKTIWLTTSMGDRVQIYKPYTDQMNLSEPDFCGVYDATDGTMLAYCWYATQGKQMLGKIRPAGRKFVVPGASPDEKKRFAGLVFKLFGFSIGDRSLPLGALWNKDWTRALWFTGEIHIVDKGIRPTTDRSDFIDNDMRRRLYAAGSTQVARMLNKKAQVISDSRKAHDLAEKWERTFDDWDTKLNDGGIERAEVKARKQQIQEALQSELKRRCQDNEIQAFARKIAQKGLALQKRLDEAKGRKENKGEINDLAQELSMTSQARKVYTIILETLQHYFQEDRDTYYELSGKIKEALTKKY